MFAAERDALKWEAYSGALGIQEREMTVVMRSGACGSNLGSVTRRPRALLFVEWRYRNPNTLPSFRAPATWTTWARRLRYSPALRSRATLMTWGCPRTCTRR